MRKLLFSNYQLIFFLLLAFCLTAKCLIWHMQFFGEKYLPVLGCMCSALLLASGALLCKRRPWWVLILLALVNVWLFSNFVYERAWGKMLSMDMIRMAGNLRGFEDSVLLYYNRDMLYWLLAPDLLCIAGLAFWPRQEKRLWKIFASVLLIWVLLLPVQQIKYYKQIHWIRTNYNTATGFAHWWYIHEPLFNPFSWPQDAAFETFRFQQEQNWARGFVHHHGILHFGPALIAFDARYNKWEKKIRGEAVELLTPEQNEMMAKLVAPETDFQAKRSLVFIMVESLESWAIDYPVGDSYVMPNLNAFVHSNPVYYSPKMSCQMNWGGSADGQLIAMTGLLPVHKGISVTLYGNQPFPNYAHYFPQSITLNPSPGTWKQDVVNPNYGIKTLEESDSIRDDAGIFKRLNTIDFSEPTFVLAITISSHVPYAKADEIDLPLDADMPEKMAKYLKCLHYMDEQLGTFLHRLRTDPALKQTDVVITGDHIIFFNTDWQELKAYASSKGLECLGNGDNYVPGIFWSPTFKKAIINNERTFQMDIYPTILHMIGCETPSWRGVGMDLLGDEPRLMNWHEAVELSDKLIRSKYFSKTTNE